MNFKKMLTLVLVVMLIGSLLAGCGGNTGQESKDQGSQEAEQSTDTAQKSDDSNQKPIVMRIGHAAAPDAMRDRASKEFGKVLEEKTGGKVKVEVYPASQLGSNIQMVEAVLQGSLEAVIPPTAYTFGVSPALSLFDLPYLFPGMDSVVEYINSQSTKELMQSFEDKGYVVLGLWPNDFKKLTANKEIHSPKDLNGLKVRVMASDILMNTYKAWGASATTLPLNELYTALAQGTADAQENSFGAIHDFKLYEVQKYIMESDHSLTAEVFLVSKKFFDSLPQDIQKVMTEEAQKLTGQRWRWEQERNETLRKNILAEGKNEFIDLSKEDKEAFREAGKFAYDEFLKAYPEYSKYVEEIIAKYH